MSDQILAQPELAGVNIDSDSEDISRGEVILKGALAAGAVYGALAVSPFIGRALAMAESGDVGILNFALTLEYLEAAFYKEGIAKAGLSGDAKKLASRYSRVRAKLRMSTSLPAVIANALRTYGPTMKVP